MNEIIVTLIASAFGTGGIAGIAALINALVGKHRQYKRLERLSETEKLFEDDETVKNSLIAARRVIATEIAASVLVRNTFGRRLLLLVPLLAIYVYLFWVMLDYFDDFQEIELYRSLLILVIVVMVYTLVLRLAHRHGRRQRELQEAMLSHELSVDDILEVTQQMYNENPGYAPEDILSKKEIDKRF